MANIGFISLGCAKNQVDCERMMYRVQEAGHTVKSDVVGSDVVVINTCGFIDSAKSEAIDYILQTAALKAEGLVGKILVTGCLSQRYQGDILKEMPEVDGILGTGSYTEIVPAIEKLLNGEQVVDFGSIDAPEVETGRIMTTAGHYAFIKIAEGCDNHCSYCVIPSLRGKYRSRQMDDVLYEARMLASSGVKELIVVAQDTSRYGTDLPGHKRLLPELLRKLCEIDGLHWIRVHYVYPDEIDDEFIQVMASEPKIVKYLDIPIQHCNSKILKLMNRRGDGEFLKALFARLRAGIPGLVIRTSLITGLPGEGEEEFAELCDFLRNVWSASARSRSRRRKAPPPQKWSMWTRTLPSSGRRSWKCCNRRSWTPTTPKSWARPWRFWWTATTRKAGSSTAALLPTPRTSTAGSGLRPTSLFTRAILSW